MDVPENTTQPEIKRSTNQIRYKGETKLGSVGKTHLSPRLKKELLTYHRKWLGKSVSWEWGKASVVGRRIAFE